MIDDFILRAGLAGVAVALAAAPLGCLVVWRRMAYFGDATGHAALLGVAFGVALGISPVIGVVAVAAAMALIITLAHGRAGYGVDTMLGVFAHSALALGLVAAALIPGARINLLDTLLGDILTVSTRDVVLVWLGAGAIIGVMAWFWRPLVNATLSPELLVAEGGSLTRDRLVFTLSLALFVAAAMKLVGILLITAMLILPAAAAAPIARSPERMVALSALFGAAAVCAGLWLSWEQDTPAGPSIIVAAAVIFALTNALARRD